MKTTNKFVFDPSKNVDFENVPKTDRHKTFMRKSKISRFFRTNFSEKNNINRLIFGSVGLGIVLITSLTLTLYCLYAPGATSVFPDMCGNDGVAFSWLKGKTGGIYALQVVLCLILLCVTLLCEKWYTIGLTSLATFGGLYNLIDRMVVKTIPGGSGGENLKNVVLDYFKLPGSVCNFPDIWVLTGIIGLAVVTVIEIIIESRQEKKDKEKLGNMYKIEIVYENSDVLVVNKPKGILVHPTTFNEKNTLIDLLKAKINVNEFEDKTRPGVVQRLDQYTNGLMVVARNKKAYDNLLQQIQNNQIIRKYRAIVHNQFKDNELIIKAPIDRSQSGKLKFVVSDAPKAKDAITLVKVIQNFGVGALVECELKTGRTHQIRVHMAYIHHPVYNDPLYGSDDGYKDYQQFLYSSHIEFRNPADNTLLKFDLEPDDTFKQLQTVLGGNNSNAKN